MKPTPAARRKAAAGAPAKRPGRPRAKAGKGAFPGSGTAVEDRGAPFPIVGVGASAGGLEAFTELLRHLPLDTGFGFVLVQHLDPQHESALSQLLSRTTSLPVLEVTDSLRAQPNHVYVIPPNTNLRIAGGVLKLQPRPQDRSPQRAIDGFFESLAEDQRERAIGVILSGTATDGTMGLEAIKAEGGITFAQDESARYDSMPRSAVAAGCVDFVLAPRQIAHELARLAKHPYVAGQALVFRADPEADRASATAHADDDTALPSGGRGTPATGARRARFEAGSGRRMTEAEDGFRKILLLLRNHSGVDFSLYKSTTIQRRIARRMMLNKHDTTEGYAAALRGDGNELNALYSDVLISVTSFFRNPEAFEVLKRKVFPKLLKTRGDEPFRVWVLGCSTGQEAYSIAMTFVEAAARAPRLCKLQVFATDLNDALLDKARNGLYTKSLVQDISPERLQRFFVEEEGGYRVSKPLREMIVFARQNLISDPPFSRMDLISCRNLLIYLEPSLQKKALPVFHYALKPGGFLLLGASESIGGFTELFEPVDRKHKVYARKASPAATLQLPLKTQGSAAHVTGPLRGAGGRSASGLARAGPPAEDVRGELQAEREADRISVNQFAPPGVLINADLQILRFRGPCSAYLTPPTGKASFDVLKMAREGLMLPLRAAINKARKQHRIVRKENVRVNQNGETRTVDLEVIPLKTARDRCFLIFFKQPGPAAPGASGVTSPVSGRSRAGRSAVRRGGQEGSRRVAQLESTLSDMREYLQSLQEQHEANNEELQASNEEVQSANEELQSVNEELETSKEELESANEELTTVNEEMANRNTELNRLNSDLLNLQTSIHLAIVLLGRDLTIRRFSPQAAKQFGLLAGDVGRPLSAVRHNLAFEGRGEEESSELSTRPRRRAADRLPAAARPERRREHDDPDSGAGPPDLDSFVTDVIARVQGREREVRDRDGRWFSLRVRPYLTFDNKVDGAVLVLVDITALKQSEQLIAAERDYAEAILRTTHDPLLVLDAGLCIERANEAFYRTFQVSPAESIGRRIDDLGSGQWKFPRLRQLLEEVLPRNSEFNDLEVTHDFSGIGRRTMLLNARSLPGLAGQPPRILLGVQDITEVLQFQVAAREGEDKYRLLFQRSPLPKWVFELETLRFLDVNEAAIELYGYTRAEFLALSVLDLRAGAAREALRAELSRPPHLPPGWEVCQHVTKHGKTIDVEVRGSALDLGGRQVWLGSVSDITDRMAAERALRATEDALREADRRKNEFLAVLAHELRNPLAPVRNMLEIMKLGGGSTGVIEQARDTMDRQVGHLTRLIDDLFDVSRISRGKIALQLAPLELASVVHHAVEAARPQCQLREIDLEVSLPAQPVYLNGDSTRLTQVLGNLLNNACKFTDRGGHIALTAEREEEQVVIRVRDTGIGIGPDALPHLFEMFMQGEVSLDRSAGGLGLGLALVKRLVELHGGTVEAQSPGIGQGSAFVVRLPILAAPPEMPAEPVPNRVEPVTARRILIVDDNRDATDSLALLLEMAGHQTERAYDGLEAVETAAVFRPDVVLLDLGLPKLSGYHTAQRIREQSRDKPLVLVALTGWGQEEDRRQSAAAGFDAHLVKPVGLAVLTRLLAELGAARDDASAATSPGVE